MDPCAVILNDTRGENHFGCMRVMRHVEEHLAARRVRVIARSVVRADWERDRAFLQALARCNLVVINGEGTLHHGAPLGERLLKVVDHAARGATPVALINALYQDNPAAWTRYLDRLALICARDSWSAAELRQRTDQPVRFTPDLSLAGGVAPPPAPMAQRDLLLVGDSVAREDSATMRAMAADFAGARLLPMRKTLKSSKPHYPLPLRMLREAYIRVHAGAARARDPRLWCARSEDEFIRMLQRGRLYATGRFHAVCFCLFTNTPFLAVESNSWKIAALLHDLQLGGERLVTLAALPQRMAQARSAHYADEEQRRITDALASCRQEAAVLFDDLAALAHGRRDAAASAVTQRPR